MRIAILYNFTISRSTGTSERVLQIANELENLGAQVTISGAVDKRERTSNLTDLRIIVMPNKILKLPLVGAWIAQVVASALTHRYDVVQIESFSNLRALALFILLHPFSKKLVIVFHDKYFEHDPRESIAGRLNLALQRILLILFDASITPGLSVKNWFAELHGQLANKISVIPNGAPDFSVKKHVDLANLRRKYGLDSGVFIALFFGAMTFKPNHDAALYLYRVSEQVSYRFEIVTGKRLIFAVAGIGSETLPKAHSYVPLGFVNQLDELLALPDAIVFPHLPSYSGPHVKTIYAFLSEKPVVASNDAVKDMPCIVPGEHFLPFDIEKPDTLTDSLTELFLNEELAQRLVSNAQLYSETFSWKHIASLHLRLFQKLMS